MCTVAAFVPQAATQEELLRAENERIAKQLAEARNEHEAERMSLLSLQQ